MLYVLLDDLFMQTVVFAPQDLPPVLDFHDESGEETHVIIVGQPFEEVPLDVVSAHLLIQEVECLLWECAHVSVHMQ